VDAQVFLAPEGRNNRIGHAAIPDLDRVCSILNNPRDVGSDFLSNLIGDNLFEDEERFIIGNDEIYLLDVQKRFHREHEAYGEFTWTMILEAFSTAALVMSTLTPRLMYRSCQGERSGSGPTSTGTNFLRSKRGIWESEMGV